jgi:hypothetical protein
VCVGVGSSAQSLLTTASKNAQGAYDYNVATVPLLSELLKLVVSGAPPPLHQCELRALVETINTLCVKAMRITACTCITEVSYSLVFATLSSPFSRRANSRETYP